MLRSLSPVWTRRAFHRALLAGLGAGVVPGVAGCGDTLAEPERGPLRALVIGSGFGGSIAALRLGQAGVRTTVLERGKAWPVDPAGGTFALSLGPDNRSTWLRDRSIAPIGPAFPIDSPRLGVLAREDFDTMKVYTGAGVGGGSLVYGCMTVKPTEALYRRLLGDQVPWEEMVSTWFPLTKQMLAASPVPDDILAADFYTMSRRFREVCAGAGVPTELIDLATDWSVVRQEMAGEVEAAAIVGELLYGANSGYKNSLDRNYLPQAVATGQVDIRPQHEVRSIHRHAHGWAVDVQELREDGSGHNPHTLEADLVVVAAGSLHTTRLLLEMQQRGDVTGMEDRLGTQWGANGNTMFMRSGLDADTGRMQANPPIVAAFDLDNSHTPIVVENAPFPVGFECNCLMQLAVSEDPQRGRLELGSGAAGLQLDWPETSHALTVDAVLDFVERMNRQDGGQLGNNWLPEPTRDFTYHPLGGAAMGVVCDSAGRVGGEPGLYVVDGALVPGNSACSNPSWLIAALAERAMATIVAQDLRRLSARATWDV
jgi:cholesterol oxidase